MTNLWPSNSLSNWNLEVLIFVEGGKPENPEKNTRGKDENQQQTQPTYDAGSANRTRATLLGSDCSHHHAIPAPYNNLIENHTINNGDSAPLLGYTKKLLLYLFLGGGVGSGLTTVTRRGNTCCRSDTARHQSRAGDASPCLASHCPDATVWVWCLVLIFDLTHVVHHVSRLHFEAVWSSCGICR